MRLNRRSFLIHALTIPAAGLVSKDIVNGETSPIKWKETKTFRYVDGMFIPNNDLERDQFSNSYYPGMEES